MKKQRGSKKVAVEASKPDEKTIGKVTFENKILILCVFRQIVLRGKACNRKILIMACLASLEAPQFL
jgi:hypothetical protein